MAPTSKTIFYQVYCMVTEHLFGNDEGYLVLKFGLEIFLQCFALIVSELLVYNGHLSSL